MDEREHVIVCALANELDEDQSLESYDEASLIVHELMNCSTFYLEDT